MARGWLIGAAVVLAASVLLAKPGIVHTRDGQSYEGDVSEKDDVVTVVVRGIPVNVDARNVTKIEYTASIDDQYQARHAKLTANDVTGRVALARWAFNNQRSDLARTAVDEAIKIDPANREAREMVDTLDRQDVLDGKSNGGSGPKPAVAAAPDTATPPAAATAPVVTGVPAANPALRFLGEDDINTIRQKEWKQGDPAMKVSLRGDIKKRYGMLANETPAAVNAMKPTELAWKILEKNDPKLSVDVHVLNDPPSIVEFRRGVQPIILNSCATSGCHGESANAGFALHSPADNDAAVYTNFYILQTYSRKVSGTEYWAVDRSLPEKSLVAEFGLSADQGDVHHPDAPNFRPALRVKTDARYKKLIDWAKKSLQPVLPNYGVHFEMPAGNEPATTQPTTAPTTRPASGPATQAAGGMFQ